MLSTLLKNETSNTLIQLFRYTLVGGLAFAVDFGSLFVCTEFFGIHYLLSAAIAFLLGLTANYLLSIIWVFNQRAVKNKLLEFYIFALLGIVGLGINELLIYVCTEFASMHYLFSKLVATGAAFLWNFASRKTILFQRSAPKAETTASQTGRTKRFAIHAVSAEHVSDLENSRHLFETVSKGLASGPG